MPNADFITKLAEIITEISQAAHLPIFVNILRDAPVSWVPIFDCIHGRGACKNFEGKGHYSLHQ